MSSLTLWNTDEEWRAPKTPAKGPLWARRPFLVTLIFILLSVGDLYFYLQNQRLRLALGDTGFTGIGARGKTWTQFHTYSEFSDLDAQVSDAAWSRFTINGMVAIPHAEAAEFGLPVAQDFPDNTDKGIYVIGAFHQLHCVIYLRETIKLLKGGRSIEDREVHVNHCYDALRQGIQCHSDDTLFYTPFRSNLTGDGQARPCRDWLALTAWARENTACWPTGHCADLVG